MLRVDALAGREIAADDHPLDLLLHDRRERVRSPGGDSADSFGSNLHRRIVAGTGQSVNC
jgi:hypothetical protein